MRYLTYIVCIDASMIDVSDPFALILPSVTGNILEAETKPHTDRLAALQRVESHNRRPTWIQGRIAWMIAVEIEIDLSVVIESVWIHGEHGILDSTMAGSFRFVAPTVEEEEQLRLSRMVCLN